MPDSNLTCCGCHLLQATARAKFDETVELALMLGTDPRRGDHAVRGTATLPHGTGKPVRVAVFAEGADAEAARAAGTLGWMRLHFTASARAPLGPDAHA